VRGERLHVDDVRLDVAHPPAPDWERQRVRNDDSVVLALRYGAVRVVLAGDIGAAVDAEVAQVVEASQRHEAPAALTVLKVAHHGSAGASTAPLLGTLRPSLAIVSSGAANPFGHPAPATLARLRDIGAEVWRTDRDGEVTVSTNGAAIEVRAHAGRRRWLAVQPR